MIKQRIVETNTGIQNQFTVEIFDQFARIMRDMGWNNVDQFIKVGIQKGNILEIGPGPGYIGLEWLKVNPDSTLTGLEISTEMIKTAKRNSKSYGLESSVHYVEGNCIHMPFENDTFDAVISNGSLHEWESPIDAFNEIYRVLKPSGRFCITDMRRDVSPFIKWFIYHSTKPKEIRPGFITSFNASYTPAELTQLLTKTSFTNFTIEKEFFGLCVYGSKCDSVNMD